MNSVSGLTVMMWCIG